jgi:acetylglutamate kinase
MKISLVKISGKTITEFLNTGTWIKIIKSLKKEYDGVILVHGGGKSISEWSQKLGFENKFVNGQRVTTFEQMEVVAAVQSGVLNTQLSAKLNASGICAMGLSGIDRGTFKAEYFHEELGFVGKPELAGSPGWIISLIKSNVIPVFSSVCMDKNGNLMNVNADVFAGTLAAAVNAEIVFFVSDVEGVKINGTVKGTLTCDEIISGIAKGDITDGMIPKLQSCMELLNKGIHKIWIGSQIENRFGFENGSTGNGTLIINKAEKQYELLRIA